MLKSGVFNPHLLSLLARIRHTNTLVIADGRFPFWPEIETVDISLADDVPTICQVLEAVMPNFLIGGAWMAAEFREHNDAAMQQRFAAAVSGAEISFEPHIQFKWRVPRAIGLIRTGDTTSYGNIILESA